MGLLDHQTKIIIPQNKRFKKINLKNKFSKKKNGNLSYQKNDDYNFLNQDDSNEEKT